MGKTVVTDAFFMVVRETPPRTWGRQLTTSISKLTSRNTPTHMGKTFFFSMQIFLGEKHPHAHGEDPLVNSTYISVLETPPRTWGRLGSLLEKESDLRNTPTHMGKTCQIRVRREGCRKHPHAHGEDLVESASNMGKEETPPRTWGRLCNHRLAQLSVGNTPTHMGKTRTEQRPITMQWKHPHAHGEDPVTVALGACRIIQQDEIVKTAA